ADGTTSTSAVIPCRAQKSSMSAVAGRPPLPAELSLLRPKSRSVVSTLTGPRQPPWRSVPSNATTLRYGSRSWAAEIVSMTTSNRSLESAICCASVEITTSWAPSRCASSALSVVRLITVVSAPSATASLTARWPRPQSPTTATRVPGDAPSERSGSQTVIPAHSSGAAPAGSSPAGSWYANRSRTTYSRAYPPAVVDPSRRSVPPYVRVGNSRQKFSWPATHITQSPHESTMFPTATESPTAKTETPAPMSVTTPVNSWPGTTGVPLPSVCACTACRSEWHTPQKSTRTAMSSSRRSRRSTSARRNVAVASARHADVDLIRTPINRLFGLL